jgi:mono/diheme cytochrome c family protein
MRYAGIWLFAMLAGAPSLIAADAVDYVRDVKPILRQHCASCHGALRQKGGLRLDHAALIRQGGDSGPAITTTSGESLLIGAVRGTLDTERMPLDAKPLSDQQIATLAAWVDAGAIAPEEPLPEDPRAHWSYQKPVKLPLPNVQNGAWATHPIDRFLAIEHERRGLSPAPAAAKNLLLRRVYLDLIGLPPNPSELAEFLADASDNAYEKVVDRLLASPHYGERWGRHWMDVWRYSDWDGYAAEVRESQPHIWRWRDWIIQSLNADKPYDEMIVEMLAADEVAPLDPNALRASGFLARNWYRFNRNVWMDDTVEHTAKAFLGTTLNCARCHDHMYDPILQTDYYQFRAIFEPYNVRADRVPGEADTKKDGLARVFDSEADKPTFLFARGNEAAPDKEHPLAPGVPAALGGDKLTFAPVSLPPMAYYPGLQSYVQQESLAEAQSAIDRAEAAMAKSTQLLAEARKKQSDAVAARAATTPPKDVTAAVGAAGSSPATPTEQKPAGELSDAASGAEVAQAEAAARLAEQAILTAASGLVAVRAKIAADRAAFADPPEASAKDLARDASRAERVFNAQQARQRVMQLEQDLAKAGESATGKEGEKKDEKSKNNAATIEKNLAEARKVHDAAQAALGQAGETYSRFGSVYPSTSTGRRTALAKWIASKNNPLTARVAINQIWMRHFGAPLVASVFDFGLNGKRPTHPALLDWLAVELMDGGWRMKPIHRLIVTSTAYRLQSSSADEGNLARDPENQYLWRMNPRRMEAEALRDSTLCVADGLDRTMFGAELDQSAGLTSARRSIYFRSSKEKKVTFLQTFDSPNVTDCYRRSETIVPQQALAMVNSSLSLAQARRLAASMAQDLGPLSSAEATARFVAAAFERILCRAPSDEERALCLEFLSGQARRFADPAALVAFASGPENAVKPSSDPDQRARENLIHVLLNHNDFLTIR